MFTCSVFSLLLFFQGGLAEDRTEISRTSLQMNDADIKFKPMLEMQVIDEKSSTDDIKGRIAVSSSNAFSFLTSDVLSSVTQSRQSISQMNYA